MRFFKHLRRSGEDQPHECRRHARGDFWGHDDHGHRHGQGRGHGRGGRLGRLFEHGDLRLVILHLIAEKPRHGYELIKAIEDMAGGQYTPSPGTVYPALTMLEEQGYVAVEPGEGTKKLYALTEEGRGYLGANRSMIETLLARMAQAGAAQTGPAPQIIRAMENLKVALRLRLSRDSMSDEHARVLAEILDRAASDIERS